MGWVAAGLGAGRTLGSVRTSLSMPSWKLVPVGLFFFMKSDMTFFDWPMAAWHTEPGRLGVGGGATRTAQARRRRLGSRQRARGCGKRAWQVESEGGQASSAAGWARVARGAPW